MSEKGSGSGSGGSGNDPSDTPEKRTARRADLGADLLAEIAHEVDGEPRAPARERPAIDTGSGIGGDWASELSSDLEVSPMERELAAAAAARGGVRGDSSVVVAQEQPGLDLRAELRASAARTSPRGEIGAQRAPMDMRALLDSHTAQEPRVADLRAKGAQATKSAPVGIDMRALLMEGRNVSGVSEPTPAAVVESTTRIDRETQVAQPVAAAPGFASSGSPDVDTDVRVRAVGAADDDDDTLDRDPRSRSPSVIDADADTGDVSVVPLSDEEAAAGTPSQPVRAPGFVDGPVPKAVDPWTDVTPQDLPDDGDDALLDREAQATDIVRAAPKSAPPRAVSARFTAPDPKRSGVTRETMDMPAIVIPDDIAPSFAPIPEPITAEMPSEVSEAYSGDGPFAAPMDGPSRSSAATQQTKKKALPPPRTVSQLAREGFANAFQQPIQAQRRVPREKSQTGKRVADPSTQQTMLVPAMQQAPTAPMPPASEVPAPVPRNPTVLDAEYEVGERRYPKMRALLANPSAVPMGSQPAGAKSRPPPVPGTFFPARKKEREPSQHHAEPADLDEMLLTMAEGLLIGEDATGQTEVRVTLRDEFFAGTELRIVAGGGRVRAVLVPPDRSTYLTLNGNIDELRLRLEARGLHVEELRVSEP